MDGNEEGAFMSRYAVDWDDRKLLVVWPTRRGDIAQQVSALPDACTESDAVDLAGALTALSSAMWRAYAEPATSADDDLSANTEGWRREKNREAFDTVVPALTKPNLPQDGMLLVSYTPVEEAAHEVGRRLHRLGDDALATAVVEDVERDLAAVQDAELGSLDGRARQAATLTRVGASPLHVMTADSLLEAELWRSTAVFDEVEPTAAAIAAAHWLLAAARVASDASQRDPRHVVMEADNIEVMPVETSTLVLERMIAGETPREVVTSLVADAMKVRSGYVPTSLAPIGPSSMPSDRLTPLDPARPAVDLLEDLLTAIYGCWLLYEECVDFDDLDDDDDEGEDEEAEDVAFDEAGIEAFFEDVRAMAAAGRRSLN